MDNIFNTWMIVSKDKNKKYNVICRCTCCGEEKSINIYSLKNGKYGLCPKCGYQNLINSNLTKIKKSWNYELNGELIPSNLMKQKNKKYWFKCSNNHNYRKTIKNFCLGSCPSCTYENIKPHAVKSGKVKKIFSTIKDYWDNDLNKKDFQEIDCIDDNRYWFNCEKGHKFSVSSRELLKGEWCPICRGNMVKEILLEYLKHQLDLRGIKYMVDFTLKRDYTNKCEISLNFDIFLPEQKMLLDIFFYQSVKILSTMGEYNQKIYYDSITNYKNKINSLDLTTLQYIQIDTSSNVAFGMRRIEEVLSRL